MYDAKNFDIVSRRKMSGLPNTTVQWLLMDMLSFRSPIMIIIIKEYVLIYVAIPRDRNVKK
jgi:hypothetical protein